MQGNSLESASNLLLKQDRVSGFAELGAREGPNCAHQDSSTAEDLYCQLKSKDSAHREAALTREQGRYSQRRAQSGLRDRLLQESCTH